MVDKSPDAGTSATGDAALKPGDQAKPGTPGTGQNVCPECNGSGRAGSGKCPNCNGSGTVTTGVAGG
jgi:DnaJ-class molecular chaperone